MSLPLWCVPFIIIVSAGVTALLLKLLNHWQIMDIANKRSSHQLPTPKGGGLGFALLLCVLMVLFASIGDNSVSHNNYHHWPLLACLALFMTLLGWLDDIRGLSPLLRFASQWLAALLVVFLLDSPTTTVALIIAPVCIVWLVNLYNFMDGIDGLASVQALLACGSIVALHYTGFYAGEQVTLAAIIGCAVIGFSLFNLPPARLFMGDTGSLFLGFVFAALIFIDSQISIDTLWLWLIVLAGFIGDATTTLLVRLFRKKRVYEAHRSHIYQLVVQHRQQYLTTNGMNVEQARSKAHRYFLGLFISVFCLIQTPCLLLVIFNIVPAWLATSLLYSLLAAGLVWAGAGGKRLFPYSGFFKKCSR